MRNKRIKNYLIAVVMLIIMNYIKVTCSVTTTKAPGKTTVKACLKNCTNGGVCSINLNGTGNSKYLCKCPINFSGPECQICKKFK